MLESLYRARQTVEGIATMLGAQLGHAPLRGEDAATIFLFHRSFEVADMPAAQGSEDAAEKQRARALEQKEFQPSRRQDRQQNSHQRRDLHSQGKSTRTKDQRGASRGSKSEMGEADFEPGRGRVPKKTPKMLVVKDGFVDAHDQETLTGGDDGVDDCEVVDNDEEEQISKSEWGQFMAAFRSVVWMTYRRGFRPMKPPSSFTTDSGWGCMLRSAQMMLAETLVRHLGADEYGRHKPASNAHRNLLRWFIDAPKYFAFYSIHRMTECGRQYGKQPGEWYGPNTVALVLRELVSSHSLRVPEKTSSGEPRVQPSFLDRDYHSLRSFSSQQDVSVYISDDGTIYLEELRRLCEQLDPEASDPANGSSLKGATKHNETLQDDSLPSLDDPMLRPRRGPKWKSALFLIIPVRLGLHTINEDYIVPLIETLKLPQCVGMIGGRPAHSLYFIGSQGHNLLYLDPHTVQPAATEQECDDEFFPYQDTVESYHCQSPRVISAKAIDPSLAVGFYVRSAEDLADLVGRLGQFHTLGLPFVSVEETRPKYDNLDDEDEEEDDDEYDDEYDVEDEEEDVDSDLSDDEVNIDEDEDFPSNSDAISSGASQITAVAKNSDGKEAFKSQANSRTPRRKSTDQQGKSRNHQHQHGQQINNIGTNSGKKNDDDDDDEGMETASEGEADDEFVFL